MEHSARIKHLIILEFNHFYNPTPEELKARWKQLCKKHHPDIGGDVEKFREVTHAYKMLSDPSYAEKNANSAERIERNLEIRIQVPLRFEEAFFGGSFVINYAVTEFDDDYQPIRKDVLELEHLNIQIAPASFEPQPIVLPGRGLKKGDCRGNAIIIPTVSPHPRYKIAAVGFGAYNVISQERVPLYKMLKGGRIEVMTMHGIKRCVIPSATLPMTGISIDGMGANGGNHIVIVEPVYPTKADLKKKEWSDLGLSDEDFKDVDEEEEKLLEFYEGVVNGKSER